MKESYHLVMNTAMTAVVKHPGERAPVPCARCRRIQKLRNRKFKEK